MNELVGKGRPFYSALDMGAKALKRKVGTGSEFLKELMALPGVKPTELKERGLESLMNEPKMTHDQFLSHLSQKSNPRIIDKTLKPLTESEIIDKLIYNQAREDAASVMGRRGSRNSDEYDEVVDRIAEELADRHWNAFSQIAQRMKRNGEIEEGAAHEQWTLPGGDNYREMLIKYPMGNFEGVPSHFNGEPNILASMRLKDRTGPNGEKLLHLEELQSDWHQQGRENGYTNGLTNEEKDELRKLKRLPLNDLMDNPQLHERFSVLAQKKKGVPDAPFKKNWEEMAIKRLIHHAAEKGYHKIVMTPGQEQADRYSLSKQVDRIAFNPENGYFQVMKNGNSLAGMPAKLSKEELPNYIGKDLTNKLLSSEPVGQGMHQLQGDDLKIGGEGMKGFYDKKVPNIFNQLGKKHGVKMELNSHPIEKEPANRLQVGEMVYEDPAKIAHLHHFPITEPMRQDILTNGLPLYKTGGVVHKAEGGNVQPSIEQMRMALQRNRLMVPKAEIQSIGANEAPNLSDKIYVEPGRDGNPSVGGVDMDKMTPGMQYVQQSAPQMTPPNQPQQPQQPPQQGGQMPQGAPQSNILSMTPQGQALGAMSPPQPPQGLAGGGQPKKISKRQQTVKNAQRIAYPGIYGNPKEIAALAASRVAPENPALKQLFGVTRQDMFNLAQGRQGMPHLGMLPGAAANAKGAASTEGVMNPRNEQRLIDVMSEVEKHKPLIHGMDPWYYMDPLFDRMVQLLGLEKATQEYKKMNALIGMASSASEVNTEIPRGSAAYYMDKLGRFNEFVEHGGKRSPTRPQELGDIPGHLAHKTAHAVPMKKFLERGEVDMSSPKVPMYIEASGVPQTGFQTRTPVGDAHWSRAVGLADTRNPKTVKGVEVVPGASVTNPEMHDLGPWWRDKIAKQLGLESVPAQARAWGAFSPQTGVTTPIGAPKLEMIAGQIMNTAKRLGVSPETARDMVLMGKERMGFKKGGKVDASLDTMRYALSKQKKAKK